ncbi:N2227-like protein-domain-containing protein [Sordaria sp. MPI-SDFR-AT-0083]|nr:N2227-like protein-domain-containing protein [Sordaria sp. MPI-SDFR-AT-0083]
MEESEQQWKGVENAIEDPEEARVIYCALDSFVQYARVAHFNCTHSRRQSFYALPEAHWKMLAAPPFNYLDTLDKVDDAIESNAELARAIVRVGLVNFQPQDVTQGSEPAIPPRWRGSAKRLDIDKARSTLRQFYRDWTVEGASERQICFGPIFRALEAQKESRPKDAPPMRVLVPGAGLGRLVFELCAKGYVAEGNEISYHQLLASSYILNCVEKPGQHTIFPWIHTFSNHSTRDNHLRSYAVPDVHCAAELTRLENEGVASGEMSMTAADFLCLYTEDYQAEAWDAVACVFFLDTAPNLIRYLETIFYCLKPGGLLINHGPLLWHFENNAPGAHGHDDDENDYDTTGIADPGSFELSDDEVMALVAKVGFEIVSREIGVESPYLLDQESMLQTVYKASSWVARKPHTTA